jgi:SAM-dependent methyltransferase
MNDYEYRIMREMEDTFWWYVTLHRGVVEEVREAMTGRVGGRVLDAGCGTGGMLEQLRRAEPGWSCCGLDFSEGALAHARARGLEKLQQGSVDALPYEDSSFDVVMSLDVLYFAGVDEALAMQEFARVLKPGGVLVLNLPAFEALRGEHDTAVNGVRRYTPVRVREMIAASGLEHRRTWCWNLWLFLPVLSWRWLSRWRLAARNRISGQKAAKSDLTMPPKPVNALLKAVARLDFALCRSLRAPVGTSVFSVSRKPEQPQLNWQGNGPSGDR